MRTDEQTEINLHRWCADQADAYRTFEDREMAMYPDARERDIALIASVLRVLARPENDGTAEVLEAIERQRAVTA